MFFPSFQNNSINNGNGFMNFLNGFTNSFYPTSLFVQPMAFTNPMGQSLFNLPYNNFNIFNNNFGIFNSTSNNNLNNNFVYTPSSLNSYSGFNLPPMTLFSMPNVNSSSGNSNLNSSSIEQTLSKNGEGYGKEFLDKVKEISKRLNCDYKDLLGVMNAESGINTKAKNSKGSATGLIQFVESTAKSLGTSTTELAQMSPLEQLDYVEKYITNAKKSAGFSASDKLSGGDLYALIFLPARATKEVLASSNEANSYYKKNKGLDLNNDWKITKSELSAIVRNHHVSDNSFLA